MAQLVVLHLGLQRQKHLTGPGWYMGTLGTVYQKRPNGFSYNMSLKFAASITFDAFGMTISCKVIWSSTFVARL